ncbi:MAG: sodium:proton antiporter NhaD [Mariniphaga sp.]
MVLLLIAAFILGYSLIAFEEAIKINKSAIALITGVLCWTIYSLLSPDSSVVNEQLTQHLGKLSGILFFLLGAMTIVEMIDSHDGFDLITTRISQTDKRKLLWIIAFITFFLSAVLDNLTTTIVIVSLLRKLIKNQHDRLFFAGIVVIAANAGGAWTPIGDVTTTMLWIGGQITTMNIMLKLFLPSIAAIVVPLIVISFKFKGIIDRPAIAEKESSGTLTSFERSTIFFSGISILILVPVFKTFTHLPPYMGILGGLGILWVITELIHGQKAETVKHSYSVVLALRKIDTASILFFFGILVSIAALESSGVLTGLAQWITKVTDNLNVVVLSFGLLSSIVDNVPLVAAAQGMYSLAQFPTDHYFWEFLAYCSGTGGSMLIIGSAAGVAAMGMEKIDFLWYLKKISLLAVLGYFSGAVVYILQNELSGL